jgi:hypothetical protein
MDTNTYIAQGKLGSFEKDGKVFQVQTEFARRPRPRVTSSVVLDGRTLQKTDREWTGDLATEEGRDELDAFIASQHRQTLEQIEARADEFLDAPAATPAGGGYAAPTILETIQEVLQTVPYVIGLYEFDDAGAITHRRHYRDVVADWDREFAALSALVFGLPNIIRVGDFRYGLVRFGAENLITARIGDRAFGILTDPSATVEHLRRDFPELFEAAYSAVDTA